MDQVRFMGAHPFCWPLSIAMIADPTVASVFNRLSQHASSPGNMAYCYAGLADSFLAVAETIASTHCT